MSRVDGAGTMALSCYGLGADELVAVARCAEEVGFDGIWVGDHVVTPTAFVSRHPYPSALHTTPIVGPGTALVDPLVALGAVGAATTRLFVGTGLAILPLYHPLLLARAGVTLHALTNGRLLFGGGTGWFVEEFSALGAGFDDRGARTDEIVEIVIRAWKGGAFSFHGSHFEFEPLVVSEQPVDIPVVLGGTAPRALRRAARRANGWRNPSSAGLDECSVVRARLLDLLLGAGRRPEDFDFHISLPDADVDAETIEAYRAAGFVHLSIPTFGRWRREQPVSLSEKLDDVARFAERAGSTHDAARSTDSMSLRA